MIFHVLLEQAEDGWIVAECPALPGCVSQGKDQEEALKKYQGSYYCMAVGRGSKSTCRYPNNIAATSTGNGRRLVAWGSISGKEAARTFEAAGWKPSFQVGSHLVMAKIGHARKSVHHTTQGTLRRHPSRPDT